MFATLTSDLRTSISVATPFLNRDSRLFQVLHPLLLRFPHDLEIGFHQEQILESLQNFEGQLLPHGFARQRSFSPRLSSARFKAVRTLPAL